MSDVPLPQPDAYEYLIANVWRTETHFNGVKAKEYRCLYATEKVHAHAAAVSAADNAALRAELLQEHADHKETLEDARQIQMERDALRENGQRLLAVADSAVQHQHDMIEAACTPLRERIKVLEQALQSIEHDSKYFGPSELGRQARAALKGSSHE
jgi:hypothetical protein